jgi:hypothetical protein
MSFDQPHELGTASSTSANTSERWCSDSKVLTTALIDLKGRSQTGDGECNVKMRTRKKKERSLIGEDAK